MDKNKALDKIKKCLALSKSANEYEAAQALKQAQALMDKYQVTSSEVGFVEITEEESGRRMAARLAEWQWNVAILVADVFGCYSCKRGKHMMFYGLGNRPQIAAYAFDVVWRQISAARRAFLRDCTEAKKGRREYLANRYCDGWLYGARSVVKAFALSESEEKIMDGYRVSILKPKETTARKIGATAGLRLAGECAAMSGWEQGKNVQLHHAMNGAEGVKQIGQEPQE